MNGASPCGLSALKHQLCTRGRGRVVFWCRYSMALTSFSTFSCPRAVAMPLGLGNRILVPYPSSGLWRKLRLNEPFRDSMYVPVPPLASDSRRNSLVLPLQKTAGLARLCIRYHLLFRRSCQKYVASDEFCGNEVQVKELRKIKMRELMGICAL